ncbi:conjugal transfer protein TrbM [Campylobacter fetus subsp. testudinum]|nr:conjugal transfer protein TrbM [Campylobacter fetus subsp. testudinum]
MKKQILAVITALCLASSLNASGEQTKTSPVKNDEILTGDVKLACEALLCLSSPHRPQECAPALQKYFSIKFKKAWKTEQARKDFLKLCPKQ